MAFATADFFPAYACPFVNDFAVKLFVYGDTLDIAMNSSLTEHRRLGMHTDVVLLTTNTWRRYFWHTPSARPFGERRNDAFQCANCGVLRFKSTTIDKAGAITWRCKACDKSTTFNAHISHPGEHDDGWRIGMPASIPNVPEWYAITARRQVAKTQG